MTETTLTVSTLTDKLSKGLGGWLMYEHHSHRADLFSEKYLTSGIGNILAGNYRTKIIAEYNHPLLKAKGAGRPPQIDFVVNDENDSVKLAVESKWVGTKTSSSPKMQDILWDIIRLELLNHQFQAQALFVLAGKKSQTDALFNHPQFHDKIQDKQKKKSGLLPVRNVEMKLDLLNCSIERLKMIALYAQKYKEVEYPSAILITGIKRYPRDCNNFENEVCVWGISSCKAAKRFTYKELVDRIAKQEAKTENKMN